MKLRRGGEGLWALLYPRAANCLCCNDPRRAALEDCLCPDCREALIRLRIPPESCDRCLSPVKRGEPCRFCQSPVMAPLQAVYAPYRYAGQARELIHAFKFQSCDEALPILCREMARALARRDFDCIVPVPLHPKRLKRRGFNQAERLANGLSCEVGIPTVDLLRRDRYRRPQSRTPGKDRRQNVEGAFSCRGDVKNLRILLLDDVRTTGSTAWACADALMKAGAKCVALCVCAVVYRRQRGGNLANSAKFDYNKQE